MSFLRCLEKDPRQRPASVAHVATALPGGDPLAAAIAAGETPSPEMVAASGSTEGLRPWIAWSCLVFVILGIAAATLLARQATLVQLVPMDANPGYLVVKAREILRDIRQPLHGFLPSITLLPLESFSGSWILLPGFS